MDESYLSAAGFLRFIQDCHPDVHQLLLVSVLVKSNNMKEISCLMEVPYRQIQKCSDQAKTLYKLWHEAEEGDMAALRILQGSVPENMNGYHPLFGWSDKDPETRLYDLDYAKEVYL